MLANRQGVEFSPPDRRRRCAAASATEVLAIRLANEADAIERLDQIVIGSERSGARRRRRIGLACDIRIAGDHVKWSSPEAKWGGFPGVGAR